MTWMGRWVLLVSWLGGWLLSAPVGDLRPAPVIENPSVSFQFGEQAVFEAEIRPAEGLDSVFLFIQPEGSAARSERVPVVKGTARMEYDLREHPLRPFVRITYWFEGQSADGIRVESARKVFDYVDNRFTWQSRSQGVFEALWIEGDVDYGQTILDVAAAGEEALRARIPGVSLPAPVRIFVYTEASELQNALRLSQQSWVAGHASADLGVILISSPSGPQQRLELERQIPHELAHILEYARLGDAYNRTPVWLLEGIASVAETYPNAEYARVLEDAARSGKLLPLRGLCSAFPREASRAFLAYAQSESFTRYLYQKYGVTRVNGLLEAYRDGVGCEEGFLSTMGVTLQQAEARWQEESLGVNAGRVALRNLSPYLLVLAFILVPPAAVGLSALRKSRKRA